MAGAFIGLGGTLAGTIGVGSELGAGPTRLLMGLEPHNGPVNPTH